MEALPRAKAVAKALAVQTTQIRTLQTLLRLAASGHDISPAAEEIVRYCVQSSTRRNPAVLSLALDALTVCPGHREWVKVREVLVEEVRTQGEGAAVVLARVRDLPRTVGAELVLDGGFVEGVKTAVEGGGDRGRMAIRGISGLVLRDKPLDARAGVEVLMGMLVWAVHSGDLGVQVEALKVLTEFAAKVEGGEKGSVAMATREATAAVVWNLLLENIRGTATALRGVVSGSQTGRKDMEDRREATKALARVSAFVLSLKSMPSNEGRAVQDGAQVEVDDTVKWAIAWVDKELMHNCDDSDFGITFTACIALLYVCSYATSQHFEDKRTKWAQKATTKLSRLAYDFDGKVSLIQISTASSTAVKALAALAKGPSSGKYILTTATQILPFAAKIPKHVERLEALCTLASTIIEFDLSGREGGAGASLTALTKSKSWKDIMATGSEDSRVPSELVSCFAQSCLEASRKIVTVPDLGTKSALTDAWAIMIAKLLLNSASCLSWPYSPSASYAREMFLKLFEALGQYNAFLVRARGGSLAEYERIQEILVKAVLDQSDVRIRASLLACITKYWLASGLKAEASAGLVLNGAWIHAQEQFRDDELILSELHRGALWSAAQKGGLTPRQRATTGGYISIPTAIAKKTSFIVETVGSAVQDAFEKSIFGSLALETAAGEGSTLVTDYAYTSFSAALALVRHMSRATEKALKLAKKYQMVLEKAESADLLVLEFINNVISALEMYKDGFYPKPIVPRILRSSSVERVDDPYAWLKRITESCVQATSRLDENAREVLTVRTEEEILHASLASKERSQPFHAGLLAGQTETLRIEGDYKLLSGVSDPFRLVVSHSMDNVKGIATISIHILNRAAYPVVSGFLSFGAVGALTFLPDAATTLSLGNLAPGEEVAKSIALAVRRTKGTEGYVYFTINAKDDSTDRHVQQTCLPYRLPSSDILLLRRPSKSAGVDVFRRRWDFMREDSKFHIYLRQTQSMDDLMDMLQRRSGCLRLVGRMCKASQVGLLVADSTRGDYIAVAAVAPEATGSNGKGPCFVYLTVRSHSHSYCKAFQKEVKHWLSPMFKVIFEEDYVGSIRQEPIRPQDAYFITTDDRRTPYQRWRDAHRLRKTL